MVDSVNIRTHKVSEGTAGSRRVYVIKPREPWELPEHTVEVAGPPRPLSAPSPLNMLSMVLPPVIMLVAVLILYMVMSAAGSTMNIIFYLMMPMMGMGMPVAQYFAHKNQTKKYLQTMQEREGKYRSLLAATRSELDAFVNQQRDALNREYPLLPRLVQTGMGISHQKRLWWRRMADPDFLTLRLGTGRGKASFNVMPPRVLDPEDPLSPLSQAVVNDYQEVRDIPLLLDMLKIGSVGFGDKDGNAVYGLARRMMLDVIIHHSPQDVQVVVLADTQQAQDRWEWLKWAPHTRAIYQGESVRRVAFNFTAMDKVVEWLMGEFEGRTRVEPGVRKKNSNRSAIFVLLDDSGDIRRTEDIRQLAESGRDADIYLMFVGGRNWPRECRAKVDVSGSEFKYTETFAGEGGGKRLRGETDPASLLDCERVARALAGWEIATGGAASNLPESVRLSEVIARSEIGLDILKSNWANPRGDEDLLQFPFGFRNGRKGLEQVVLNLLPPGPEYGDVGKGAYHTILVGTTGSGKSEFMKSLVLSAAFKYPPNLLNFFFMDFKGGAAFNVLKELPHVVGVVTNLSPQLVERGLSALEAEFERRQKLFANSAVSNIWSYNAKNPNHPIPHLMLLLDEFARGMADFSRLPEMLDKLVRIGRSLGVYLLLANQDVNAAVDRLLNNVGWHIALKVARQEEMYIVDRSIPKVDRTGQGYLHSQDGDITEFQAAYAGFTVADPEDKVEQAFRIYQVEPDGKWKSLHTNMRRARVAEVSNKPKEQDQVISLMKEASSDIDFARPIYLEPLETDFSLESILEESGLQRLFVNGKWTQKQGRARLLAPIGYTDSTDDCVQDCLQVDFEDQDGHLWLIGGPSSGKAMTIESTLLSLALTNTPDDAQFYIIEFGAAGQLRHFRSLPHCGAVITQKDPVELFDRLLQHLDNEMNRRANKKRERKKESRDPEIFLVVNNFGEFRTTYPDHAEKIVPLINGKTMGIHLILATNRRVELPNKLVVARKVVLRLANKDEYSDAIGGRVTVLPSVQAEGRGLWVDKKPLECQIAQPRVALDASGVLLEAESACQILAKQWRGAMAPRIRVLPTEIPLVDLLKQAKSLPQEEMPVPVGASFETAEMVAANLLREIPRWLVLGPPRSGKTNFLTCLAKSVLASHASHWDILYISLRRAAPSSLDKNSLQTASSPSEATLMINELIERFDKIARSEKRMLLLLDDLGAAFEPGRETFSTALNTLALRASTRDDIFIVGAGLPEELRPHQMMSKLVQNLKTSRTGIGLSKDTNDVEMLGIQVPLQYKRMELPPGRGFWVSGGKFMFLQTPWAGRN